MLYEQAKQETLQEKPLQGQWNQQKATELQKHKYQLYSK